MSNRDGKHQFTKHNPGKKCPRCGKGKLERTCKLTPGHKHHVMCKTCNFTNF